MKVQVLVNRGPLKFIMLMFLIIQILGCSNKPSSELEGMVAIPAGPFIIGSVEVEHNDLIKEFSKRKGVFLENEVPLRKVYLKEFL